MCLLFLNGLIHLKMFNNSNFPSKLGRHCSICPESSAVDEKATANLTLVLLEITCIISGVF